VNKLAQRFDTLAKRERVLVFCAFAALVLGAAFALVADPALARSKDLSNRIAEHQRQLAALVLNQQAIEVQLATDVNAGPRAQLSATQAQLHELEGQIKGLHQTLIPARSMAKVMSGILQREGTVRLISLRNIPAEPLTQDEPAKTSAKASKEESSGLLYKHGVELVVEGGYFDLLSFLAGLEKQPWRMLWAETSLSAEYPKARLRMKLYTLSLDPSWLSV
jgi:MSHA biogenesis protein MshJ